MNTIIISQTGNTAIEFGGLTLTHDVNDDGESRYSVRALNMRDNNGEPVAIARYVDQREAKEAFVNAVNAVGNEEREYLFPPRKY